jgi:hypothetical protein
MSEEVQHPARELILLSPYRLPAQNAMYLSNEDVAAWLNGYSVLWHPALAQRATSPPRVGSPYDHEQPVAGNVYAVPESPPLMLPDDWEQRVRTAGALSFRATSDRQATLANLREALRSAPEAEGGAALPERGPEQVAPYFGIGFGYLMVEGLFEAMEHQHLLATTDFWLDIQQAIRATEEEEQRRHLRTAAERLLAAREVLYPVTIHLLDICLLDEQRAATGALPAAPDKGLALNLVAPAALLEKMAHAQPERWSALRERIASELLEVCGGCYLEREDALLPVGSQLWNLLKGQAAARELLQQDVRVFGRKRFTAHPQLPLLLSSAGLQKALLLTFDEAVVPTYRSTVINWPSPDGKQVEAFTRSPHAADNPQTFFHIAHHLHRTIMQDHAATLALLHTGAAAAPWYEDWLELSRLAPVLGRWTTFGRYFGDVLAGEYTAAASADEFHGDYLSDGVNAGSPQPVSGFARHVRWRRRLDSAWTLAAFCRSLAGRNDEHAALGHRLAELEDQLESAAVARSPALEGEETPFSVELAKAQNEAAEALCDRLQSRAAESTPGYLVLNPCSFARRLALEMPEITEPLPLTGSVKACQIDSGMGRLVVEVPALGFAWFPRFGGGAPAQPARMKLADQRCVRNEFFEAEVDPTTGGLRGLRDHRSRINRIGQQLVFNPGSTPQVKSIRVTSTGPALGEIISEGVLVDEHQQVLASFRQRFRAWLGRPLLEMRLEITPQHLSQGYPWHAYYGARFAWRDERATLLRAVNGAGSVTTHTRPETLDYLELRSGSQSTVLLPGGLPFHQRHGSRMLDVILLPQGETARTFDLALGLDRELPMHLALGMISPAVVVPTRKGPPHIGASGWLFHVDAPNLMLLDMRPAADGVDGVIARMLECSNFGGHCELRCVRDPQQAHLLDARGTSLMQLTTHGDIVPFEVAAGDLAHVRVDFS